MATLFANSGQLDRVALGLSGLCLVHCMATAVLLAVVASAGGLLGAPIIHEVGLSLAMVLGAIALGRGVIEHGCMFPAASGALGLGVMAGALQLPHDAAEIMVTMLGIGLLALGHWLNFGAPR
ncbi:MAG TPA: MerC domain-containing protein [Sphingomicrobium sp.]|nr:MerC domain-containing protein [Sphingomicrobium sp.]